VPGALDTRRLAAQWTGIGRYVARLNELLPRFMGDDAPACIAGGGVNVRPEGEAKLADLMDMKRKLVWEQVALPLWLRRNRPSFLHLPWYEGPAQVRVPLVITIHDLDTLIHATRYSWRFRAYYNGLLRHYAHIARRVITVSETSARDIEQHLAVGHKTVVIPQAADPAFFLGSRDRGRAHLAALGLAFDRPIVISASGVGERKNLATLGRALRILSTNGTGTILVLTATTEVPASLHAALTPGVSIVPAGRLSTPELADLYAAADVSVSPSLYEGFGFSLVEAMAAGCPVVASDAGSHGEVAGGAALLCHPTDARALADRLLAVLDDGPLRERMIDAGRRRARRFDWDDTVRRTGEI
jgi:glycosyltransferase involved in cell wall biosynthesis